MDDHLLDRIYEAAVIRERWPALLHDIAVSVGAGGGIFRSGSPDFSDWVASPRAAEGIAAYIADGWADDPTYAAPFLAELHPGFRTETDYRTIAELEALPVYREHLVPRGAIAGAGTVIQGAADHVAILTFEGFPSHRAAREAIPVLDALRPHLARAMTLSALKADRSQLVTDSLALVGAAAAVVDRAGRIRAMNDGFARRMADQHLDQAGKVRFADDLVQARYDQAVSASCIGAGDAHTIAMRYGDNTLAFALHVLPIARDVRAICDADGALLLIADPENLAVPSADLLRLLFDLSPAEARLARYLQSGLSVKDCAIALEISELTARTQLRSVFAKTGITRQSDLILLLTGINPRMAG